MEYDLWIKGQLQSRADYEVKKFSKNKLLMRQLVIFLLRFFSGKRRSKYSSC